MGEIRTFIPAQVDDDLLRTRTHTEVEVGRAIHACTTEAVRLSRRRYREALVWMMAISFACGSVFGYLLQEALRG